MNDPKKWWLSKTMWVAILTAIVGSAEYLDLIHLAPEVKSALIAAIGVATIVLRVMTDQPIKNSPKDPTKGEAS
jgi:hypothetical protein